MCAYVCMYVFRHMYLCMSIIIMYVCLSSSWCMNVFLVCMNVFHHHARMYVDRHEVCTNVVMYV